MQNVYRDLMTDMRYNKFIIGDLLFVEYTCPLTSDVWSVWTESDFIIHVIRGKKRLFSGESEWMITEGETVYVKKGSFSMNQYFDDEFCMLGFFVNDDFIRSTLSELKGKLPVNANVVFEEFNIKKINTDAILNGFFTSMYPYFKQELTPSNSILELKLKELVIHLLTSGVDGSISSYFQSLLELDKPGIRSIMENNFYHNLSINEFAELTHRSLSAFKRDFNAVYRTTPGRWLLKKRLDYSMNLLKNEALSVTDVAYQSGFENLSHFSRSFKSQYNKSPSESRSN